MAQMNNDQFAAWLALQQHHNEALEAQALAAAAAAAAAPAQAVAPRAPAKRTRPMDQSGAMEWVSWRANFELCARINMWDNSRAREEARGCFQGKAEKAIMHVPLEAHGPIGFVAAPVAELLDLMAVEFMPPAASTEATQQFQAARQQEGEDLIEWKSRCVYLFTRAFPAVGLAAMEADPVVRTRYIMGISNPSIRDQTLVCDLPTMAETHAKARALEAHGKTIAKANGSAHVARRGLFAVKETGQAAFIFDGTCYNCNEKGHMKRNCPKPMKERGQGRGRGGSFRGRGGSRYTRPGKPYADKRVPKVARAAPWATPSTETDSEDDEEAYASAATKAGN
jgi:hypothetical protein